MTTAIANSNTTTNTSGTAATNNALAQLADNYQTFLSLLTTQLQNQDPTSPLDTNQFTQQLTQMTGVEQQLLSNQLLQQLVNQNEGGGLSGAVGLIGKTATADDSTATLNSGAATWEFSTASAPTAMTATVSDSNGNVVWSGSVTPAGSGAQAFTWNGQNSQGVQQSNGGTYTLSMTATDASGNPIAVSTDITGTVAGVSQANGTTMVSLGGVQVPVSSITNVND